MPDDLRQVLERISIESHFVMVSVKVLRYQASIIYFICGLVESQSECLNWSLKALGGRSREGTGIESSRKIDTEGHIADQLAPHRLQKNLTDHFGPSIRPRIMVLFNR